MLNRHKFLIVLAGCLLLLAMGIPLQNSLAYTHTVLVEEGTATWCVYCPTVAQYLSDIYSSGLYDFYYVALVADMNSYAAARTSELGLYGYPTCFGDGGYQSVVGAYGSSTPYINMINNCGARTVANLDLAPSAAWMGNAQINVGVNVTNNGTSSYNGRVRVYVTEIESRWYVFGTQYHYAMIGNYAVNQTVNIPAGGTATLSALWDGNSYGFGDITQTNIMVIVSVFNSSTNYTDETAAIQPTSPPGDVTVTLTPYGTPIVIPAAGGQFGFNVALANNEITPWSFAAWSDVTMPDGSTYGPLLGPVGLTLGAGATLNRDRTQAVPGSAPAGIYTYNAYVGNYPSDIWDSASFTFEKSATGQGDGWINDWTSAGEPLASDFNSVPNDLTLVQNYPNPFNPETTIAFELPNAAAVTLTVFDLSGREVAQLVNGYRAAGHHEVTWEASAFSAGVYFYRLSAGSATASGKMILMK